MSQKSSLLLRMHVPTFLACLALIILPIAASGAPVGYWSFDNDTAADSSGNGLDGTLNGGAGFSDDVPAAIGSGRSLQLATGIAPDGSTGDYVDLGNPSLLDFGTGDFTVAGWIKTDQSDRGNFFSNGGDDSGGIRYVLALGETGPDGAAVLTTDDNSDKSQAVGTSSLNDNAWHHVAAVRSGETISVYVDGAVEGTNSVPAGYDLSGTSQKNAYIGVGRSEDSGEFIKQLGGLYDDVAVWDIALPASHIAGLASGSIGIPEPGSFVLALVALAGAAILVRKRR